MSAIVAALKNAAEKIGQALGHDASHAHSELMHSTGNNLRANAQAHLDHDAKAAADLERAGRRSGDDGPTLHGGDSTPAETATGCSGPSVSAPPTIPGGSGGTRPPFPGEEPLSNPTEPLSAADHPYLQPSTPNSPEYREDEALPGEVPETTSWTEGDPGSRAPLDEGALSTFSGPVRPFTMQPGTTYYRSVGDGAYPTGGFWSETPPVNESQLRSDYAVLNNWNGDHGIVTFTPEHPVQGWEGEVAPQPATGGGGFYLPGGGRQVFIPRGNLTGDGNWTIAPAPQGESS